MRGPLFGGHEGFETRGNTLVVEVVVVVLALLSFIALDTPLICK